MQKNFKEKLVQDNQLCEKQRNKKTTLNEEISKPENSMKSDSLKMSVNDKSSHLLTTKEKKVHAKHLEQEYTSSQNVYEISI